MNLPNLGKCNIICAKKISKSGQIFDRRYGSNFGSKFGKCMMGQFQFPRGTSLPKQNEPPPPPPGVSISCSKWAGERGRVEEDKKHIHLGLSACITHRIFHHVGERFLG